MKDIITDALRYWEPRRIPYNLLLGVIALWRVLPLVEAFHGDAIPDWIWVQLLILGLEANILYCAAYVVDVFVQMSDFQAIWRRYRWLLWVGGMAIGAGLAWVFAPMAILWKVAPM